MAVRSKPNYKSTKDLIITTNGVGDISGADVNSTFEDSADSFVFNNGTSTISSATWDGSYTSTSGVDTNLTIQPTVNQASGTGGSTALKINVITTTLGSGVHNILQLQDTGTDKLLVNVDGTITVTNKIVSVSGANIDIEPDTTGNVLLGNFTFDADQSVGAGQDNFVLTYDDGTGLISLKVAAGGGGAFTADGDTQITPTTPILLDQATGDEIGLDLSLTVNKATSGNYTAIKCNVTETAAPGSSDLLIDLQVGASPKFTVDNDGLANISNGLGINGGVTSNTVPLNVFLLANGTESVSFGEIRFRVDSDAAVLFHNNSSSRMEINGDGTDDSPHIHLFGRFNTTTRGFLFTGGSSSNDLAGLTTDCIIEGYSPLITNPTNDIEGGDLILDGGAKATAGTNDGNVLLATNRGEVIVGGNLTINSGALILESTKQEIRTINLQLTQAQIQALNTTPIEIIAAPGSGKYIHIIGVSAFLDHNGTTYATADVLRIIYTTSGSLYESPSSFISNTSDKAVTVDSVNATAGHIIFINEAVLVTAAADATNNGGTIDVYIQYVIVDTN